MRASATRQGRCATVERTRLPRMRPRARPWAVAGTASRRLRHNRGRRRKIILMRNQIHAITLDLDDTIWPFAPSLMRAEAALDQWMREHAPRAAERWPLQERERLRAHAKV